MNFDHIKGHYFQSHRWINPTGIVPKGPIVDFDAPVASRREGCVPYEAQPSLGGAG